MTTPLLVRVDNLNTQTSSQYAYARSPVRIGRNPLNDLALEFPFVSQWHAVVQFDDNVTQFIDLGSTNGTAVNGQRVGKNMPVPLAPNLEFRIGALRIYFARGPAPPHLLNQRQGNLGGGFGAQKQTPVQRGRRRRSHDDGVRQRRSDDDVRRRRGGCTRPEARSSRAGGSSRSESGAAAVAHQPAAAPLRCVPPIVEHVLQVRDGAAFEGAARGAARNAGAPAARAARHRR